MPVEFTICTPSSPTSFPFPVDVTLVSVRLDPPFTSMPICLLPVALTLLSVAVVTLKRLILELQVVGPLVPFRASPHVVAALLFAVPLPVKFIFFRVTLVAVLKSAPFDVQF